MNDCKYEWKIRISRRRALIKEIGSLCSPGERFPGSDVCPAAFSCEKEVSRSKSCKMSDFPPSMLIIINMNKIFNSFVCFSKKVNIWSSEISKFYPFLHLPLPMNIPGFVCHDANFSEKRSYEFSSDPQYVTQFLWHLTGNWKLAEFLVKSIFSPPKGGKVGTIFSHSGRSGVFWRLPLNHLPPRPLDFYALQENASSQYKIFTSIIIKKMPW